MTEAYRPESGRAQITPIEEITNPYELNGLATLTDTTYENSVFSSEDGLSFKLSGLRPEATIDGLEHPIALYDGVLIAKSNGIAMVVLPDLIDHKTGVKTPDEIRIVDLVEGETMNISAARAPEEVRYARDLANQRRDERLGGWTTDVPYCHIKNSPTEEY